MSQSWHHNSGYTFTCGIRCMLVSLILSLHCPMQFVMIAMSYTAGTVQYTVNFNLYLILVMIRTPSSIPRYRTSSHSVYK